MTPTVIFSIAQIKIPSENKPIVKEGAWAQGLREMQGMKGRQASLWSEDLVGNAKRCLEAAPRAEVHAWLSEIRSETSAARTGSSSQRGRTTIMSFGAFPLIWTPTTAISTTEEDDFY
ncbi:hypothetical protein CEXT_548801 [Caerostris extrusa]|uniref:Uncharacterized protein n=1 Tax=Caerostris extrusa TaxID=172846 RepID=A0AAV4XLG8_CAEEX|nr:hypothetical protein CEXT_548801 [Caerostris extrusa]